ncbi:MAG: phage holin family protein [Nocardioidaceae bacterium]|nr:phage holin family protein [Nocardioidaceae bacterium]
MYRIFTAILVNAAALAVASWLFAGIRIGGADTSDRLVTLLAVALIFGLVNALVAPIIKTLALPFIILTLGMLLVVINALMLLLVAAIADGVDVAFRVDGFWSAVGGALVISVVSWALGLAFDND